MTLDKTKSKESLVESYKNSLRSTFEKKRREQLLMKQASELESQPVKAVSEEQLHVTNGSTLLSQLASRLLPSMMSSQGSNRSHASIAIELQPRVGTIESSLPASEEENITDEESYNETTPINHFAPPETRAEAYETALAEWRLVTQLDLFLDQVYKYYQGKGLEVLFVTHFANWLTMGFVVAFTLCLRYCIDWSVLLSGAPATPAEHPKLWQVFRLSNLWNMSGIVLFTTLLLMILWLGQLSWLMSQLPEWRKMRRFYTDLLGIPDDKLATTDFSEITTRIVALQAECPISVDRLNAHDIANRLMRCQNYLIAMYNKDILKLDLPFSLNRFLMPRNRLTRVLEWNMSRCIFNHFFDDRLGINRAFLQETHKDTIMQELRRRFIISGCINALLSPFIAVFTILYFFYRYGEEIYRNPKMAGTRQYTPYAQWKFREFNELPHFFQRRLANSYRKATKYLEQFHNEKIVHLARLTSFVLGSCVMVLIILSLLQQGLLTNFELTPGRTAIWYIGVFGAIVAISRSFVPDELRSDCPQRLMSAVIAYTHYDPPHWHSSYHTDVAYREFKDLFQYKFAILLHELIGIVTTPFLLCFSLPACSKEIVDFFREFTVHVEGVGYVCSFALFDFKRHGVALPDGEQSTALHKQVLSEEGKMEQSMLSFAANHPEWTPTDPLASRYLLAHQHTLARAPSPADTNAALANVEDATLSKIAPGFKRVYGLQPEYTPMAGNVIKEVDEEEYEPDAYSGGW